MSSGQQLAAGFYRDVVADLVGVPHAAALVGEGSEVLGFDDDRSTDHSWGPRVTVFVAAGDLEQTLGRVEAGLPETYRSEPVRFYAWRDQRSRHHVSVTTVADWVRAELGQPAPTAVASWLGLPQQRLLHVTAGVVFHDDRGELARIREQLAYFPDDVWWWMQASQWQRVAQHEHLPGRLAEVGDPRGARVEASHLVRLLMELAFLQGRRYWPYPKWFGTAFGRLDAAADTGPLLDRIIGADHEHDREAALARALQATAARHNRLDPDHPLDPTCRPFEVGIDGARRPYLVLNAGRFVQACLRNVDDPDLRQLAPVGAIDQLTRSGDLVDNFTSWPSRLATDFSEILREAGASGLDRDV